MQHSITATTEKNNHIQL